MQVALAVIGLLGSSAAAVAISEWLRRRDDRAAVSRATVYRAYLPTGTIRLDPSEAIARRAAKQCTVG